MDCRTCRHADEWDQGCYDCKAPFPVWAVRHRRPLPRIWLQDGTVYHDRADYGKTALIDCNAHEVK